MNRKEALKLCALIELEYPRTYRDLDDDTREAVVKNWQTTFSSVNFLVMQMAFDAFRKRSKFPPKTADMIDELRAIYEWAFDRSYSLFDREDEDLQRRCRFLMAQTERYSKRHMEYSGVSVDLLNAIPEGLLEAHASQPQLTEAQT